MQGNLKQTFVPDVSESLPPPAELRAADWVQELLWLADYQRDHSLIGSPAVLQRPRLGLSFLPVSCPGWGQTMSTFAPVLNRLPEPVSAT